MKGNHKGGGVREMAPEYDFTRGQRGRYAKRYAEGSNIVMLDPDVAEVFRDSETVNEVLRLLVKLKLPTRSSRRVSSKPG